MYQEIISFWFEEIETSQWWVKDAAFDQLISDRFSGLHLQAINCELFSWRTTSLGALAEVIVLDQFSRNMFRDTPQSFAYDSLALALAQSAIAKGQDVELASRMRSFLYTPFMHSESPKIHVEAEGIFASLGIQSTIDFEKKHRDIIDKYGRYPHRNRILNRISTPEEAAFLMLPGSGF